jgi:hypothetical protein
VDTGIGIVIGFQKRQRAARAFVAISPLTLQPKKDAKTTTTGTARVHPASPSIVAKHRSRRKYAAKIDTSALWRSDMTAR